jgi:DnaJ-class molecular chaperone
MSDHKNYYDVLEISKTSTAEEIKKGYNKLAKKWHPDRNLDNVEEATQNFKEISVAYGVLSDPQKKDIYDNNSDLSIKNILSWWIH